jgi:hypothetical protein
VQPHFPQALQSLDGFGMNGNAFFDFSGPLGVGTWDEAMLLSPNSWPADPTMTGQSIQMDIVPQQIHHLTMGHYSSGPRPPTSRGHGGSVSSVPERSAHQPDPNSTSPFSSEGQPLAEGEDEFLVNTFLQMLMPPILTPVETGPKWASTRAFFGAMATESPMVRLAVMAFAAMQMQRSGLSNETKRDWRPLYDNASRQLSSALAKRRKGDELGKDGLKYILASIFLLTYTDVSTLRITAKPNTECSIYSFHTSKSQPNPCHQYLI